MLAGNCFGWPYFGESYASTTSTTISGSANVTAAGSLNASGICTRFAAAAATGSGSITAAGFQTATGVGSLTGLGTLTAAGGTIETGTATLTGTGTLTATGFRIRLALAGLTGIGTLAADGTVTTAPHVIAGQIGVGYIERPHTGLVDGVKEGRILAVKKGGIV